MKVAKKFQNKKTQRDRKFLSNDHKLCFKCFVECTLTLWKEKLYILSILVCRLRNAAVPFWIHKCSPIKDKYHDKNFASVLIKSYFYSIFAWLQYTIKNVSHLWNINLLFEIMFWIAKHNDFWIWNNYL